MNESIGINYVPSKLIQASSFSSLIACIMAVLWLYHGYVSYAYEGALSPGINITIKRGPPQGSRLDFDDRRLNKLLFLLSANLRIVTWSRSILRGQLGI